MLRRFAWKTVRFAFSTLKIQYEKGREPKTDGTTGIYASCAIQSMCGTRSELKYSQRTTHSKLRFIWARATGTASWKQGKLWFVRSLRRFENSWSAVYGFYSTKRADSVFVKVSCLLLIYDWIFSDETRTIAVLALFSPWSAEGFNLPPITANNINRTEIVPDVHT